MDVVRVNLDVDIENETGRALYEKCGFVVYGEEQYMPHPRSDGTVQAERTALKLQWLCRSS